MPINLGFGRQNNDPNRQQLKPWQRLIGIGANMVFPGSGIATNAIFNGMNNRVITPMQLPSYQAPNFGLGMTVPQGLIGSNVSTAQLGQQQDAWLNQQMQARINAANQQPGGQQNQQGGQAPIQANQVAPMTYDQQRQALNAQYADLATQMAIQNYQRDIGFTAPGSQMEQR